MSTTTSTPTLTDIKKLKRQIVGFALSQGFSVALWRLPNQQKINLLVATNKRVLNEITMEELKSGFVMAPFSPTGSKYFLEVEHLFEFTNDLSELTHGQFAEQVEKSDFKGLPKFHVAKSNVQHTTPENFIELVKLSINAIESGAFQKVVPSAQRKIEAPTDFDLLDAFDSLNQRYPAAMVSLVSDSTFGTWMGASPELLVSTDKHNIFRTVALAGTQPFKEGVPMRSVSWTQKEIEEQALVERYIISCFKKIRVREYDEYGPKTVQAGNLIHLKSEFEVNMKEVNLPQMGSVMLKLLHPTSAVCGMPMDTSYKFLEANEGYDREFYAGYLGPVNIDSESHLFVNLRCLKWYADSIIQFAGAGVTIDSVPDQELKEVEIKFETIRKAIQLSMDN
jgi:isochorismate synthase